jgi:YesN/AraC family two-component response regulator
VIYDRPVPPPEGYLNKPVDEDKLVSYVAHIIETKEEKAN